MDSNPAGPASSSSTATDAATRTAVDLRRLPWVSRLAADYAYDFPRLAPFYSADPANQSAWTDAIARAQAQAHQRGEIAAVLAAQQSQRGAPTKAVDAARRLADPSTVAVVTGQQVGLFGGPLFTLLKALTAIKLAAKVSRDHHVPAVAVFWAEGEDHDWDEVRSCMVLDEALAARAVSLAARSDVTSVARVQLDESISSALDELESILPATEFRTDLLASLRQAYAPGAGMASAFARWIEHVLGDRGLVVFDSSDPAAKPIVGGVFTQEIAAGETTTLASAAGARLAASGYHAQVQSSEDAVALFAFDDGRRAIKRQNGQFLVGERVQSSEAMLSRATATPSAFSPNVLLRPIVQDTLFPTICYVAGPSELAYLGQLRSVYQHFGLPMPLIYPRITATLVDSGAVRFLNKYSLPLHALQPQDESALNQLLQAQIPAEVENALTAATQAIEQQMARVIGAMPLIDPTLEGAAKSTLGKIEHDLATLRGKTIQAAKRRDETLRRQYLRTRALAFPGGHAQERTIGFVSFLNQYGPALIDRLDEEIPLELGSHWIVAV